MIRGQNAKLDKVTTKDMKKKEMVCMIRSDKKLKNNISGFSAMKKDDLKANLEKALAGEKPNPRKNPTSHKWNEALKKFNEQNVSSGYLIPKKGTKEYDEVKKIMSGEVAQPEPMQVAQPDKPTTRQAEPTRKKKLNPRAVIEPTGPAVRTSTRSRVKPIRFAEEDE